MGFITFHFFAQMHVQARTMRNRATHLNYVCFAAEVQFTEGELCSADGAARLHECHSHPNRRGSDDRQQCRRRGMTDYS